MGDGRLAIRDEEESFPAVVPYLLFPFLAGDSGSSIL
jgi:hypothetical protein